IAFGVSLLLLASSLLLLFCGSSSTELYPLSLHDALPISPSGWCAPRCGGSRSRSRPRPPPPSRDRRRWPTAPRTPPTAAGRWPRSEEHTSELQSREKLVCRLLLEKKKRW